MPFDAAGASVSVILPVATGVGASVVGISEKPVGKVGKVVRTPGDTDGKRPGGRLLGGAVNTLHKNDKPHC